MKYVGNYKNWIQPGWIDELIASQGTPRPSQGKRPTSSEEELEYEKARAAGYKDSDTYFWMFDKNNLSFVLPTPPFVQGTYHWWITKMLPGNFMPMHVDPHTLYEKNSNRYWMALQDWQPGHIFMYEDQVITNYCAGDVYVYDNSAALHGAANIGHTPRLVLQVSTYDE
jgi:hypothetical protein